MKKYYLKNLDSKRLESLIKRPAIDFGNIFRIAKEIIADVKKHGDEAVKSYTKTFDKVILDKFSVSGEEINEAEQRISAEVKKAFETAAKNIFVFHSSSVSKNDCRIVETTSGIYCFSKFVPVDKVGIYVPGGSAILPSTVLMLAIPAKIAGCKEIVMCTPPQKDGKVSDIVLYAAKLAGVTKIFKIGGAQAIAAMAYGTDTVPKVYKIFGPGNQYVTAAKMLLSLEPEGIAIDFPAGPSEVLVVADEFANEVFVASDLLSQAEHGPDSQVVLVCTSNDKAEEIMAEVSKQLKNLPRKGVAAESLEKSFCLIVDEGDAGERLNKALEFSNEYAPEHLILNTVNSDFLVGKVRNAGSVFLGPYSCESAGDYASGPNHTLPTYGYAKVYGGLCVDSFMKKITFQKVEKEGAKNIGKTVEIMADVEGLFAHKNAMSLRLKSINNKK